MLDEMLMFSLIILDEGIRRREDRAAGKVADELCPNPRPTQEQRPSASNAIIYEFKEAVGGAPTATHGGACGLR